MTRPGLLKPGTAIADAAAGTAKSAEASSARREAGSADMATPEDRTCAPAGACVGANPNAALPDSTEPRVKTLSIGPI